jgi:GxxExxY protein
LHHEGHEGHEVEFDKLSNLVIGCAIEVHKALGPGLLESAYEQCLVRELSLAQIPVTIQQPVAIDYKGFRLDCGYRLDLLVDDQLIVELKSVDQLLPIHEAQLLTYMKLAGVPTGLLMNFNEIFLKDGIRRFVL